MDLLAAEDAEDAERQMDIKVRQKNDPSRMRSMLFTFDKLRFPSAVSASSAVSDSSLAGHGFTHPPFTPCGLAIAP
jgi:hypothetical protein